MAGYISIMLLVGVVFGIFTSLLAARKGYSAEAWFWLGFFFSIIALLVAVGLPPNKTLKSGNLNASSSADNRHDWSTGTDLTKKCPDCAETIKIDAKVCRYCGRKFSNQEIVDELKRRLKQTNEDTEMYKQVVVLLAKMNDDWAVKELEKDKKFYKPAVGYYAAMQDEWAIDKIQEIEKEELEELKKLEEAELRIKKEEELRRKKEEELEKQKKELRRQAALAARPAKLKRLFIIVGILIIAAGAMLYLVSKTSLSVSSMPSGAKIYIDNKYTGKATPQVFRYLIPGKHTLKLTKEGYEDFSGPFTVKMGSEKVVNTNLELSVGSLSVSSNPAGAEIYIDSGDTGAVTPQTINKIVKGKHILKLTKEGYKDFSGPFTVEVGNEKVVDAKLELATGSLSVSSVPNGAKIYINNSYKGIAPLSLSLTKGLYSVKVIKEGYNKYETTVSIQVGNKRNIYASLIQIKPAGSLVWRYKTGAKVYSSPAVYNSKVYFGSYDHYIYCLNAENGGLIWKYKAGGPVSSSPTTYNGKVYVGSEDHYVYCLNAESGNLIWRYKTGSYVEPSPTIYKGRMYIGSGDHYIYCLNAETGSLIWKYKTGSRVIFSSTIYSGKVYIGSEDCYVDCLDAENGSLIWKYKTGGSIVSSPAVYKGRMYIGSGDHYIYCLDAENGSLIWKYKTGNFIASSPTVYKGKVYIGSGDHYIYCLNAENGSLIWKYKTGGYTLFSPPAVYNGRIYTGTSDYYVYCLNAETGSLIWKYKTGNFIASSPTVYKGKVYIGSGDHYIYCLNITNP